MSNKSIMLKFVLLFFCLVSQCCVAKVTKVSDFFYTDPSSIRFLLYLSGASYKLDGKKLNVIVDQSKVLSALPMALKLNGLIYKKSATLEDLESQPTYTSLVASLQIINVLIPHIYNNFSNLSEINVYVYLIHVDIYGNTVRDLIFSFHMNRQLNEKIVWDRFNMRNAIFVFPNFQLSHWLQNALSKE